MDFVIVLAILAIVFLFVSRPIWQAAERGDQPDPEPDKPNLVAELEAARDAKYVEIRDAELDLRTGKLSQADFEETDRALRAEAIEILGALDQAEEQLPSGHGHNS